MTMTNEQKKNLRIYEALAYEAAFEASMTGEGLTLAERDEARRFVDGMRAHVIAKQRADRAAVRARRVRPSILAMTRDAMIQRLGELFAARPAAVFAFRDLTAMSDDDLRTALEDAETLSERQS
jgi:hypothetical protein